MKNYATELIGKISKSILETGFLSEYKINQPRVENFLESNNLTIAVFDLLSNEVYDTKEYFELFKPLLYDIAKVHKSYDLMDYIYKYTVSLSFPETFDKPNDKDLEASAICFLKILKIVSTYQKSSDDESWQSKYPIEFLSRDEEAALESDEEYKTFKNHFESEYAYEMMKLNQEIVGYTTLDHVCGVHHIAMKIGRQLKNAGIPVDMGRVSGAAIGHDIGKFGCKGDELKRVAYFHYYYTGKWFEDRNIVYIRNIAINHSTWDLELENLHIEALILIYADFRVKSNEKCEMTYYSLQESFKVILDKLDNVDAAKEDRYKKVYRKLNDFEEFLVDLGVEVTVDGVAEITQGYTRERRHFSLLHGNDVVNQFKYVSIEHSVRLMNILRDEDSLNKIIEHARELDNVIDLRAYIEIFEEYHTYLTHKQKLNVLNFLYFKLMSPQEDIRKKCAQLIGRLISGYDEELRKELPADAQTRSDEISSVDLFDLYINKMIEPEQKIIGKHRGWICFSLQNMVSTYLEKCKEKNFKSSIEKIEKVYEHYRNNPDKEVYLINAIKSIPMDYICSEEGSYFLEIINITIRHEDFKARMSALNVLCNILETSETSCEDCSKELFRNKVIRDDFDDIDWDTIYPAEAYAKYRILEKLNMAERTDAVAKFIVDGEYNTSDIFLSNLKTATYDITKKFQVQLLIDYNKEFDNKNSFYTAMHFCNLLKVSALESVRNTAGSGLIELIELLKFEQRNDIVVELLRALEMESFQFTRYIPDYLGELLLYVKPIELDEIIEDFTEKIKRSNAQTTMLLLRTMGIAINRYSNYRDRFPQQEQTHKQRLIRMIGILLNGFVSYIPAVNQMAIHVIGRDVFGDGLNPLIEKNEIFKICSKKLLSLLNNTNEANRLIFLNNAAGLKHIYQFISDYSHGIEPVTLAPNNKIAFFPGSFDPFSLSHKQIATEIRDLGFEVYLSVDEFSWSKRTQSNLIRREIIKMSVANEIDIFTYPRDVSINIANEKDLDKLKRSFNDEDVYIVVGSDVIANASAYDPEKKAIKKNSITSFPHIIFKRMININEDENERFDARFPLLNDKSITVSLDSKYEVISSTQIRNYVDENRDISDLVDPLAQKYIYEKGLYQREPQFKDVIRTHSIKVEIAKKARVESFKEAYDFINPEMSFEDFYKLSKKTNFSILLLRDRDADGEIIGVSLFHWLRTTNIFTEFSDEKARKYIIDNSIGRILVINGIFVKEDTGLKAAHQIMLTETIAYGLSRDFTYAIYRNDITHEMPDEIKDVLKLQGFTSVENKEEIYTVNMASPCTLSLDIKSLIKEPYRNNPVVSEVIHQTRKNLQVALTELYPGNLVLSFDRKMIYEHLTKIICNENKVPVKPVVPRELGKNMCVPLGDIFKRWIMPNTVTKAIHVEKYFSTDLQTFKIEAYPYYLDKLNQVNMLKSFNRPVLLIDDILSKGYRIKEIEPIFKEQNLELKKVIAAILSGQGKALMESKNIKVESAYFIPRLHSWFSEGKMYPFIGGDAVWYGRQPSRNMIPSVNLVLPYAYPTFLSDASNEAIYKLSEVSLENSKMLLEAIENQYQLLNDRMLTFSRLGEVLSYPRYPYKGEYIKYDAKQKASEYLAQDIENLKKLKDIIVK